MHVRFSFIFHLEDDNFGGETVVLELWILSFSSPLRPNTVCLSVFLLELYSTVL